MRLDPLDDQTEGKPGYWRNEITGRLAPVVEAYLAGRQLDAQEIAIMRAYLTQWIEAPAWHGDDIAALRIVVRMIETNASLSAWLHVATEIGIDPL